MECCYGLQSKNLAAGTELFRAGVLLFVLEFEVLIMRSAGEQLRVQADCEPALCHYSKEANSQCTVLHKGEFEGGDLSLSAGETHLQ